MRKSYIIMGIVGLLMLSLSVSLAYFAARIEGEGAPMTLNIADLKIVFTDSPALTDDAIYPGWTNTKTFTVKNESNETFEYDIVLSDLINTFETSGYLQYKITSDNDGYNMSDYEDIPKSAEATDIILAYSISIPAGVTQTYSLSLRYLQTEEDQSEDMGKTFSGSLAIEKGTHPKLYDQLLADNPTRLARTSFDTPFADENVNTLYTVDGNWTEDGNTVYYFAGNAQNNWVKFGQDQDGADLYWRIIRTNEDGSIRMLYTGTSPDTESAFPVLDGVSLSGGSATTGMYNSAYNNPMYAGYMYGTTGDLASNRTNETSSPIKTVLDSWYSKTINTKTDGTYTYDSYVSKTAIYCNDRSTDAYSATAAMYYGAYRRLVTNKQPSYKCGNDETGALYSTSDVADKFSASTASGGNGALTHPIALMTADEILFAGGVQNTNSLAWYYYNSVGGSAVGSDWWWTMSPSYADSSGTAIVFYVGGSGNPGHLRNISVSNESLAARPVVSLKSCVGTTGGDGSNANPYTVKVDDTCAIAEN